MQEMQETRVQSLGREDPLEKERATHSSILAWEIPWTEETGGLQSKGSQKSQTLLSDQTTSGEQRILWVLSKDSHALSLVRAHRCPGPGI